MRVRKQGYELSSPADYSAILHFTSTPNISRGALPFTFHRPTSQNSDLIRRVNDSIHQLTTPGGKVTVRAGQRSR